MVRAAKMKLTVDKTARTIVNISGGGCPDVPCLSASMIGHTIETLPGFLCILKKKSARPNKVNHFSGRGALLSVATL